MEFYIIRMLLWPVIILGVIIAVSTILIARRRGHTQSVDVPYRQESMLSQVFFFLAIIFLVEVILAYNRQFDLSIDWQTAVFVGTIVGFAIAYVLKSIGGLLYALAGLYIWWISQGIQWLGLESELYNGTYLAIKPIIILTLFALLTVSYYVTARLHDLNSKYKRYSTAYLLFSLLPLTILLFIYSTGSGVQSLHSLQGGQSVFQSPQLLISLIIIVLYILALTAHLLKKRLLTIGEAAYIGAVLVLFIYLTTVSTAGDSNSYYASYNRSLSPVELILSITFNFLAFLEMIGLMFLGYYRRERMYINLGVFGFIILIIIKYFDWFFTFLDKSVFFIGAGILLFVVGWLMEHGRRSMIHRVEQQQ